MVNYRGFSDLKFILNLPKQKLETLIVSSTAYKNNETEIKFIWNNIKVKLYSLESNDLSLGFTKQDSAARTLKSL
jgi:hypothetical protein